MNHEVNPIKRASRGLVLIFAACVFLFSRGVEAKPSKLQSAPATPTPAEILGAAENAMGTERSRASIRSISAVAACHGPKGDYETRIISERSGNLSFQQFFPERKNIAGILDGRGWQLGEDGHSEWIDTTETSVLRGHEFPLIALDLRKRFHGFKTIGRAQFEGQPVNEVAMVDEFGHQAKGYFSLTTHLPVGLTITNPRTGGPRTIRITFDAWRAIGQVNLVSHVTILYNRQKWIFDFKTLNLNVADSKAFQVPAPPNGPPEPK